MMDSRIWIWYRYKPKKWEVEELAAILPRRGVIITGALEASTILSKQINYIPCL